jgi:hypothetical protein
MARESGETNAWIRLFLDPQTMELDVDEEYRALVFAFKMWPGH